ncbi:microfibril-associated glycoprotein 4-like [Patiria miniata]|uniref:Uncharacterized protein n=1 Tax=Patiria miniata TaxID=46514 RepID=A0A914AFZ5_PATMI|nr:microfibril-associated glycoprotein 4-like [Patiria miniata]
MMRLIEGAALLICTVTLIQDSRSECLSRYERKFYPANNRALQNHVYQRKTGVSPVVCGRDCSMDVKCASFNYNTSSQTCQLNKESQSTTSQDFITRPQSLYFDGHESTLTFSAHQGSCQELYEDGSLGNGIYTIYPPGMTDGVQVYCDMVTEGGGWTVIQRRQDGSVDFYRNWTEYQSGFGQLSGEFWLGNNALRALTASSAKWQLRVDLEDWDGDMRWAEYGEFSVQGKKYSLRIGYYDDNSTLPDSLIRHNGYNFSTKDQDNDILASTSCAVDFEGAWWYRSCHTSNLNGKYYHQGNVPFGQGIQWKLWKGFYYSFKKCSMKIREVPKDAMN